MLLKKSSNLDNCSYLIHDRDTKYCESFRNLIESGDVKTLPLPARSPNLNAFAQRWVKSVKDDCLSKFILFGETSLKRAFTMLNGIIKVKTTYCYFQFTRRR